MKKTKIIATIGPSSDNLINLKKMILSGMNIARINMSHQYDLHDLKKLITKIRKLAEELDHSVAILFDLCGPKIRVSFQNKRQNIKVKKNQEFTLGNGKVDIPINLPLKFKNIKPGALVKIDDGYLSFKVEGTKDNILKIKSQTNGEIINGKGINLPGIDLDLDTVTKKDIDDVKLALELKIDWLAMSFVRSEKDILKLNKIFQKYDHQIPVIAKIEKPEAIQNLKKIAQAFDGILVARGDLGVEMPINQLPLLQKEIVNKCLQNKKPVIIATQMLESMINNVNPTRAEVNDIANAIYDGVDAVMLSAETAVGKYPTESVEMMSSIAYTVEADLDPLNFSRYIPDKVRKSDRRSSICHAAMNISNDLDIKAIIVMTESGSTAIKMAQYRPNSNIYALCPYPDTCRMLSLIWGVTSIKVKQYTSTDEMISNYISIMKDKKYINKGDKVIITAGVPIGISGTTNMIKIHVVD
ncbi:MAG: pyruvate kinase [Candidatus Marinimicrobia bacterium]|nr:pyruvate kinase [Candidatus Neomarinimicrobiota bacterium]|tara:strand:- start:1103 stop:2512 length:1410 start_codon:yes stop_codon:yes gene_type:complete